MKYLSILFAAALISTAAKAQDHKFELGLTGGGDITWVQLDEINNNPHAWSVGLNAQYNWTERFSLNTKFLYNSKILKTQNNSIDNTTTMKSYMIPLTARWYLGQNNLKFLIDGGVQFTRGFETIIDSKFSTGNSEYLEAKEYWTRTALVFGTGAKYTLTDKLSGVVEARLIIYDREFSNDVYGENTQLLLGITYGL